jgi:hypothetical protein
MDKQLSITKAENKHLRHLLIVYAQYTLGPFEPEQMAAPKTSADGSICDFQFG